MHSLKKGKALSRYTRKLQFHVWKSIYGEQNWHSLRLLATACNCSYGVILQREQETLEVWDNKLPDLWSSHYSYSLARCTPTSGSRQTPVGLPRISTDRGAHYKVVSHLVMMAAAMHVVKRGTNVAWYNTAKKNISVTLCLAYMRVCVLCVCVSAPLCPHCGVPVAELH